jgi:hypothetical protein
MNADELVVALNEEIARLKEVRRLLSGENEAAPGRKPGQRRLSAEARKRMSEAQRKRWKSRGEVGAKG